MENWQQEIEGLNLTPEERQRIWESLVVQASTKSGSKPVEQGIKIELQCCEGKESYEGQCLGSRCHLYREAKCSVDSGWPYVGTGYGNLYGSPTKENYLSEVRRKRKN